MEQLITLVDHMNLNRLISVAGTTIWVYDYALTVSDEYAIIWPTKWSLVKVLYMINRYITVPYLALTMFYMLNAPAPNHGLLVSTLQNPTSCRLSTISGLILRELELFAVTGLMLIRVRSLYMGQPWATWLLCSTFVVTHVLTITFAVHSVAETYASLAYFTPLRICTMDTPTYIKPVYFVQIPFEILLLGMQLNHYWGMSRAIEPVQLTPLLATLYTDGVIYFVATITVRVWGGCAFIFLDQSFWYMTLVVDLSTSSVFISWVILHLNKVSRKSIEGTVPTFETTVTLSIKRPLTSIDAWMEMDLRQWDGA